MAYEQERGDSSEITFTKAHAAELRAMLEAEQSRVPTIAEKRFPGFERGPLSLEPIENDERFQPVKEKIGPLRAEADALRDEYTAYIAERDAGGKGNLTQDRIEWGRARQAELRGLIRSTLAAEATPVLRERLNALVALPAYSGSLEDLEKTLDLEPSVAQDRRTDYGACDVDVSRIVTTPSQSNWAGYGYTKTEGSSPDLILGHALKMLAGEYDESNVYNLPRVRAAMDRQGNYVYLAEDGTHRIGAAKLLGRRTLGARVEGYNYTPSDPWAKGIDNEQRARQKAGPQSPSP